MTARMAIPRKGQKWEVFNAADERKAKRKGRPRRQRKTSHAAQDRKAKRRAKAKRIGTKRLTHSQLVKRADAIFGAQVRSVGFCQSGRPNHAGPLQCAHHFSRRYEATRWTRINASCLCAGCHVFFTHRPLEWDEWLRAHLGRNYESVRLKALNGGKQDMDAIIAELEGKEAA